MNSGKPVSALPHKSVVFTRSGLPLYCTDEPASILEAIRTFDAEHMLPLHRGDNINPTHVRVGSIDIVAHLPFHVSK